MKTVLVTGATAGIGEACARAFVEAGWRVIATGRRAERLDALVEELGADRVHPCVFDVRDETARDAALAALPAAFSSIDCLVNNAGLALGTARAQDADLEDWKTMIETNVTSLIALTHKLLPQLIARGLRRARVAEALSITPFGEALCGGAVEGEPSDAPSALPSLCCLPCSRVWSSRHEPASTRSRAARSCALSCGKPSGLPAAS